MKKIIIAFVFSAVVSTGAFAQNRGGDKERFDPEKRAEMQTKRMSEELSLNENQQKKLLALNIERNKKSADLGKEATSKRKDINESYKKSLDEILTPEQKEKLKEKRKEGRAVQEGERHKRAGKRPGKPAN